MTILDRVGNTPLIALPLFSNVAHGVSLWAKAEFMNPK